MFKSSNFRTIELMYYKLLAPFECRNYKLKITINQFAFLISATSKFNYLQSNSKEIVLFDTNFGKFYIRNTILDFEFASPGFERQDLNELIKRMSLSLSKHKKIVFIDIGADFGTYTVKIGNYFKNQRKQIKIFSFEPNPECFDLLKRNIKLNKLTNVKIYKTALSDSKKLKKFYYHVPMQMIVSFKTNKEITIKTNKLDRYLKDIPIDNNTALYIKLDIEGHEPQALKGGFKTLHKTTDTTLLVEDVTDTKVITFLKRIAKPLAKKSNQNSFWKCI